MEDSAQTLAAAPSGDDLGLLTKLPPLVQRLVDGRCRYGSADHRECGAAATEYLIQALPLASRCAPTKHRVRRIFGLGRMYTANLTWLGQWTRLQTACKERMTELGLQVEEGLFERENLAASIGAYDPTRDSVSPKNPSFGNASAAPLQPCVARQCVIPAACRPNRFGGSSATHAQDLRLERAYIHFLRLLGLALNLPFQKAVQDALPVDGAGSATAFSWSGCNVSSGGVKGYERMFNKMLSAQDHRLADRPRPACNVDIVRCLVTFELPQHMLSAFDSLQVKFGSFIKFKNGMAWSRERAASQFYLRTVLAIVNFSPPEYPTFDSLRADSRVQKIWSSYEINETAPATESREVWARDVRLALQWLRHDLPSDTRVQMPCEVQMLLKQYLQVRATMHEMYKVVRATSPAALDKDFSRDQLAAQEAERFGADGNSPLRLACRDGNMRAVDTMLESSLSHGFPNAATLTNIFDALRISATYSRPDCARAIIFALQHAAIPPDTMMAGTSIALRSACVGLPKKAQSLNTVNVLLDAKADANSVATIETLLEQCVASITPCEGVQGMPPAASLRKDVKPRRSAATALWEASRYGRSQIVARLLEGRSNVNILAPDSSTALYAAAQAGHVDSIQVLLQGHAEVDRGRRGGRTPLMACSSANHVDGAEVLLLHKADPNAQKKDGTSSVYLAVLNNAAETLELLLESKASPDVSRVPDGVTAVSMAAQKNHVESLLLLVRFRANIHPPLNDGRTPVFIAAQSGAAEALRVLVGANADVHAKVGPFGSAADIAAEMNHVECLQLISGLEASAAE